jgi:YHS domain-containing protein
MLRRFKGRSVIEKDVPRRSIPLLLNNQCLTAKVAPQGIFTRYPGQVSGPRAGMRRPCPVPEAFPTLNCRGQLWHPGCYHKAAPKGNRFPLFEKGLEMKATERNPKIEEAVIDPVCGMKVTPDEAEATTEHKGETYYFCSVGCKDRFKVNPKQYKNRAESE